MRDSSPTVDLPDTTAHDRRMQQLGEQAASVAHGLNGLLAAIVDQSAQLLAAANAGQSGHTSQGTTLDPATADALRLIHQAALDGAGLTRRLLHDARGDTNGAGAASLSSLNDTRALEHLETVDLGRVLADAVELTRWSWHDAAARRGASVHLTLEAPRPLPVRGIPSDLREIVVNLIRNADDAMPTGGTLLLRGALHDGSVTLTCQDSGLGMPPEVQARLFEPFFTTKGSQGNGLGMAIVQRVVARHGGEVQVTSQPGLGTTVTIHLPAATPLPLAADAPILTDAPSSRARAAARDLAADELATSLSTLSLLVVDDDPIFRGVFVRRLSLDARRVEAVGDADAALAALETGNWDVVCLDDGLPDRSGRDLAAEIRRRNLPCVVILVTGAATSPDDPGLLTPGVDAVLPKPCTDAELACALQATQTRQATRTA